jgi:hypothetical protein
LVFTLNDEGTEYSVTSYTGQATIVVIPEKYNALPVTSIGARAFNSCSGLTKAIIPNSVTSIGGGAFEYCSSLTSVTIGNSVTSIGQSAFYRAAYYNDENNWQDGVLYIGQYLIEAKSSISGAYTIKEGTKLVADSAFEYCSSLTSVTIPDSVTSIEDSAFRNCSSLTSVTIPDSVTSIGYWAFSGCSSLTSVYISDIAAWCNILFGGSSSNPLFNAHNLYLNGTLVTELTIPNGVTSIGDSAFSGCSSLTSVTIPESVTSIGSYAFYYCSGLTSVTIPDSVTSIGGWAFHRCSSLTSVTIGNSVTSIGNYAFYYCTGLTSITIPNSVTSIGDWAFAYCSSLTSVTIGNSVTSIGQSAFYRAAYYNDENNWQDGVLYIGQYLIEAKSSISGAYTIKEGTRVIADHAFEDCSGLIRVTIPDSVTSIGYKAFYKCSALTSVTIPNSVTSIGWNSFYGCDSLTSVVFENTSGWFYTSSSSATSGTSIENSDLTDSATAAKYLTSTYCEYYWKRS